MSLPITDMSREEAQIKHNEIKQLHTQARGLLLEIRDRNGWKALGFESFEEYGAKEWGYSRTYINRLAKAEEIQKSLDVPSDVEIPESQLRPLNTVPVAERKEVFETAQQMAKEENKPLTAKHVTQAVNQRKPDDSVIYPCQFEGCKTKAGLFKPLKGLMYCESHYAIFSQFPPQKKHQPVEPVKQPENVFNAAQAEAEQAQKPLTAKIVQKKVDAALVCGYLDGKTCNEINNGMDVFNPHTHKTVSLCHPHYADYKNGLAVFREKLELCELEGCTEDTGIFHSHGGTMYCEKHYKMFSQFPPQKKPQPVEPVKQPENVFDEIAQLAVNEYYGALAENLIAGLNDALKNMESFNHSKLSELQRTQIRSALKRSTADQVAQSIQLLKDTTDSLLFVMTGIVKDF